MIRTTPNSFGEKNEHGLSKLRILEMGGKIIFFYQKTAKQKKGKEENMDNTYT